MTLKAPVLPAYETNDRYIVWCDHCRRWHIHSPENGHRTAHCHQRESPYDAVGYILRLAGPATPAMLKDLKRKKQNGPLTTAHPTHTMTKRKGLTRQDKITVNLACEQVEEILHKTLLKTINGKVYVSDDNKVFHVLANVKILRQRFNDYPEIAEYPLDRFEKACGKAP